MSFFKQPPNPPSPVKCPWCGRDMAWGHLIAPRGDIFWYAGPPSLRKRLDPRAIPLKVDTQGTSLEQYRAAWLCTACRKMGFDVQDPEEPTPSARLFTVNPEIEKEEESER